MTSLLLSLIIISGSVTLLVESCLAWGRYNRHEYRPGDAVMVGAFGLFVISLGLGFVLLFASVFNA